MRSIFQKIKLDSMVVAIISIIFGILLLIWPTISTLVACYVTGIVLVICGVLRIIDYFRNGTDGYLQTDFFLGLVFSVAGVWILFNPEGLGGLIFAVLGIVILLHGFLDLQQAFNVRRAGYPYWYVALILGFVSIVLAALILINPFGSLTVLTVILGVSLIYDGVSDIWTIGRLSQMMKNYKESTQEIKPDDYSVQ